MICCKNYFYHEELPVWQPFFALSALSNRFLAWKWACLQQPVPYRYSNQRTNLINMFYSEVERCVSMNTICTFICFVMISLVRAKILFAPLKSVGFYLKLTAAFFIITFINIFEKLEHWVSVCVFHIDEVLI